MTTTLYPASERAHFDFGWLNTYHTFSFGKFYDPSRMNFGALRVINDDTVTAGEGFGTHPHRDMEIISIPLEGVLMHQDSMGHQEGIGPGEVQVMSAGTGITHSEFNGSREEVLKFFQIWIIPERAGVEPRYDQAKVGPVAADSICDVVGPKGAGAPLWINQQTWLSMGHATASKALTYECKRESNGIFVYVVDGVLTVRSGDVLHRLGQRDGLGIVDASHVSISTESLATFIVIDVPMA